MRTRYLHCRLAEQNRELEDRVRERTAQLEDARIEILERLSIAAEYRDDETNQHTARVGDISAALARALGQPDEYVQLIRRAAPLHDLGKIGIPDAILLKPGKLTAEEFTVMKTHTLIGARTLGDSRPPVLQLGAEIALTHHERWDGTGYPHGLAAEAIPLCGRIVGLIDVFDALTHVRPYKPAWSTEDAVAEITRLRGIQFDPHMIDIFVSRILDPRVMSVSPAPTGASSA